ncbi:unnamed protein product [Sympodiomycopsis kandeliae]
MATSSAQAAPIPWDDQIVPALRKKLEAESAQLSKRISVLDQNGDIHGTSHNATNQNTGWGSLASHSTIQSNRGTGTQGSSAIGRNASMSSSSSASIYATPTRARSQKFQNIASGSGSGSGSSPSSNIDTEKARERARMIRERKASAAANNDSEGLTASAIPTRASQQQQQQQARLRTHSTPMQYQPPTSSSSSSHASSSKLPRIKQTPRELARAKAQEVNRRDRQEALLNGYVEPPPQTSSSPYVNGSEAGLASSSGLQHQRSADPLRSESSDGDRITSRRIPSTGPSNFTTSDNKIRNQRSGSIDPSMLTAGATSDPSTDIFSLEGRSQRSVTEPPPVTGYHDWDEVLPPAIARRVAQEELLRNDPSVKDVDKLIDTWDKQGLPLSQQQITALVSKRREREMNEIRQQQQQQVEQQQQSTRQEEQIEMQPLQPSSSSRRQQDTNANQQLQPPPSLDPSQKRNSSSSRDSHHSSQQNIDIPRPSQSRVRNSSTTGNDNHYHQQQQQQQRLQAQREYEHNQLHSRFESSHSISDQVRNNQNKKSRKEDDQGAGCCSCIVM